MSSDPELIGVIPKLPETANRLTLDVSRGVEQGRTVDCSRLVTLIGSRPGCKVVLKHKAVSPVHLAVVNDGTKVTAVDLVSAKGTQLNGLKLEHETLNDGDILTVIDALAQDVGIIGLFSDWPATTTFYANCMKTAKPSRYR